MKNKNKSVGLEIAERLRELNKAVKVGESISERFTCNRVILDLQPRQYDAAMVKRTRSLLKVSQSLFAQFLGVSTSAVRSWEQGVNPVPGVACRFMDEIERDPEYWKKRVRDSIVDKQVVSQ